MKPLRPFVLLVVLTVSVAFSSSCDTRDKRGVPEADLRVPADRLPKALLPPHARVARPNQISGVVRRVFEDTRGNLWFATQNGILRHDGNALLYYDFKDPYGAGVTGTAVVEDPKGNVWLGTTGGLIRYDGSRFATFSRDDGLANDCIWCLFVDAEGTLWAGTTDGAFRYDGRTFTRFPIPPAGRSDPDRGISNPTVIHSITQDRAGDLWFVNESDVFRFDGTTLARFPVMEGDSPTFVSTVLEARNGDLWFGTWHKASSATTATHSPT